ncbi:MAG: hypothetical protein IKD66_01115 [Solobacterium sp.]|nr:hypothetical protein [Solobacterium sp.]
MTLNELERLRELRVKLDSYKAEISAQYNTYHSPALVNYRRSSPGSCDPVTEAVNRITTMQERIQVMESQYLDLLEKVEDWLIACDDKEVAAIIRWHYILCTDWKETTRKVFRRTGNADYFRARKRVYRYFGEEE